MIYNAIKAIESQLTSLAWVERYGGLTRLMKSVSLNDNDDTIIKFFPSPCNTDLTDCGSDYYSDKLVPDDSVMSIVYFEQFGNQTVTETKKGFFEISNTARLIVWLNLKKLGVTTYCDIQAQIMGDLLGINGDYTEGTWKVNARISTIEDRNNTKTIFRNYGYSDYEQHFFYPIEAMSFIVNFKSLGNCAASFTPGVEVECVNYANV